MKRTIWIGYEPRETNAYLVARDSIRRFWSDAPIEPVILDKLRHEGLYRRTCRREDGRLMDVISNAPMTTEFAISRFLVPMLAGSGCALFMDCDMLVRADLRELFDLADDSKAVMCVKHEYVPKLSVKMDDQVQTRYPRKNWSSVMLFNCWHPANQRLTVDLVNTVTGRDLHNFCWLNDADIGGFGPEWNWLVGEKMWPMRSFEPKIVHFTNGIPTMSGYERSEFSDEWRDVLWKALR